MKTQADNIRYLLSLSQYSEHAAKHSKRAAAQRKRLLAQLAAIEG